MKKIQALNKKNNKHEKNSGIMLTHEKNSCRILGVELENGQ